MERLAVSRLIPPPVHPEDDPPMARALGVLVSLAIPAWFLFTTAPSDHPRQFAFACVAGLLHGVYGYWAWRARVYMLPQYRRTARGWGASGYRWRQRWMFTSAGQPLFLRMHIAQTVFVLWTFGGMLLHLFLRSD